MTEFEDIRIIGMDKKYSKPADQLGYVKIYLTLSSMPDNDWEHIFQRIYLSRGFYQSEKVEISGTHIVMKTHRERVRALKDRLETDVADTNAEYRKHINEKARRKAEEAEAQRVRQEKEREQLDNIESLLFDED